ncbi:hypothetical protein A2U01_0060090 [Trifolium medium]|uniref:Uncharacterized protein n=1 Tax=Trifolium medium TaxID=97028 RepID=A0A392RQF4_9FABA|nr:hypothetical protein [Trifolium medium]
MRNLARHGEVKKTHDYDVRIHGLMMQDQFFIQSDGTSGSSSKLRNLASETDFSLYRLDLLRHAQLCRTNIAPRATTVAPRAGHSTKIHNFILDLRYAQ